MLNQARLKALKVREDHVRNVLDEARKRLSELTKNTAKYSEVLKSLIVQGLLQLLEPNVVLRVREADVGLTESILPAVMEQYTKTSGSEINIKVDQESFLPVECCGGVDLLAHKGRIKIANTLEARLDLIAQQLVPQIRNALFGINTNRKFTD